MGEPFRLGRGHAREQVLDGRHKGRAHAEPRRPMPKRTRAERGWPAISPHRVTGVPVRWQASSTICKTRKIDGLSGSHRCATLGLSLSAATRYWIRSFDPMEIKSVSRKSASMQKAAAGTSTMTPVLTSSAKGTASREIVAGLLDHLVDLPQLFERGDHGKEHRDLAMTPARKMALIWVIKSLGFSKKIGSTASP